MRREALYAFPVAGLLLIVGANGGGGGFAVAGVLLAVGASAFLWLTARRRVRRVHGHRGGGSVAAARWERDRALDEARREGERYVAEARAAAEHRARDALAAAEKRAASDREAWI
jgi:hypothetical protein